MASLLNINILNVKKKQKPNTVKFGFKSKCVEFSNDSLNHVYTLALKPEQHLPLLIGEHFNNKFGLSSSEKPARGTSSDFGLRQQNGFISRAQPLHISSAKINTADV